MLVLISAKGARCHIHSWLKHIPSHRDQSDSLEPRLPSAATRSNCRQPAKAIVVDQARFLASQALKNVEVDRPQDRRAHQVQARAMLWIP